MLLERGSVFSFALLPGHLNLGTHIYIGMEAVFIDKRQGAHWVQETHALSKMLYSLASYIQQKL